MYHYGRSERGFFHINYLSTKYAKYHLPSVWMDRAFSLQSNNRSTQEVEDLFRGSDWPLFFFLKWKILKCLERNLVLQFRNEDISRSFLKERNPACRAGQPIACLLFCAKPVLKWVTCTTAG